MTLEILYHDSDLVAINKPAGLLVHRSRVDVHASEFALQRLRDQIGQPVFPAHRIDRPTSGVLLFALSSPIAKTIAKQFEVGSIEKSYTAIVRGHPPDHGGTDEPLVEKQDRMTDRRARQDKPAQPAETFFETRQRWTVPFSTGKYPSSRYSLVIVTPKTGRKHQIRRHFNHMAWPIIGDTTHGDRRHNRLFRERFQSHRLLLVASSLTFAHPISGDMITVKAELGEQFNATIDQLNSHNVP